MRSTRLLGFVAVRRLLLSVGSLALLSAALLGTSSVARAQTWINNNGIGFWATSTNWSSPPAFTADSQLVFPASLTQQGATFAMINDANATVNRLTFALDGTSFVPTLAANSAATLYVGNDAFSTTLTLATSSSSAAPTIAQNGNGGVLLQPNGLFGSLDIAGANALQFVGTGTGAVKVDAPISSAATTGLTIGLDPTAVKAFNSGGTTILTGNNSFTGNVTLNSGSLGLGTSTALGNAANQLIINAGPNSVRLVAPATSAAPITIANPVVLNGTMLLSSADGGGANFTGGISGAGGITLNNFLTVSQGFFQFSGAHTPRINIQSPATFTGPLVIKPMGGGAGTGGSDMVTVSSNATSGTHGSLTTTNIQLYPAGYLALNNSVANQTRLAPNTTITSYRGFVGLFANATVNAAETIGTLNAGGMTSLYAIPTAGAGSTMSVTTLNRSQNGTFEFRGTNLGAAPGPNVANIVVTNNPGGATPGSTTPGTQNLAVLPYAYANSMASTSLTNPQSVSLVRYDAGGQQLVPLNTTTEYANALALAAGTTPGLNYYLGGGGNGGVVVNSNATVNGLVLVSDTNSPISQTRLASIGGTATLNVTGPIVLTALGNNTQTPGNGNFMASQISVGGLAFGSNTAYVHAVWPALGAFNYIASPMSGTGGFVKSGPSDVILYGTNGISGGMTINAGSVVFDADAQLGVAGGSITMNSGNVDGLNYTPNTRFGTSSPTGLTLNRPIILGPGGGTLSASVGTGALTYTGAISGSGSLFKGNVGNLFLNPSSNTATGDVVVTGGTLIPAGDAALGVAGNRVIVTGGIFQPGAGYTSTGRDFMVGPGGAGTIYTAGGDFAMNGTIASQLFSTNTLGAAMPGLVKIGNGNLTLTNNNTLTGSVTIGEVTTLQSSSRFSTPNAIQPGGALTLSGAKGALALASGFSVNDGASLVLDNSGAVGNMNNDRVGTVPIALNGTSAVTLIGNANGPVSELVGALSAGTNGSFLSGAQTITVSQPASGGSGAVATLATTALTVQAGGTLLVRGTNLGALTGDRGQFLTNVDTLSATSAPGLLIGVVSASTPTSGATDFAISTPQGSQFSIVPLPAASYGTLAAPGIYSVADLPATTSQLTGATSLNGIRVRDGGGLDLNGNTLTLGNTTTQGAQAGMILSTGAANGGIVDTVGGGLGTIEFGSQTARIVTPTDLTIGSPTNPVALQQNTTLPSANSTTTLVKSGAGTLTLYGVPSTGTSQIGTTVGTFVQGSNRATNVVYIAEGKLVLGNANALGRTTNTSPLATFVGVMPSITVDAGATLDINNQSVAIQNLAGAGTVAVGTGTLTLVPNAGSNFSGQLTGTAASSLVAGPAQAAGTSYSNTQSTILMGDNSGFLGTYRVNQGSLQFRSAAALNGNPIVLGDVLSPTSGNRSTTVTFLDTGTNFTSDITVPAMTLQGTATVPGAALIVGNLSAGGFVTLNGTITMNRATNIGSSNGVSRSGMFTVASKITGPGQLVVNPNVTFVSSGGNIAFTNPLNDYAGGTVLNAAAGLNSANGVNTVVAIGADTVFSNGAVVLDNQPGVLRADGGARNLANVINVNPSTSATTRPVLFGFVGVNDFTLSGAMSSTLTNPASAQVVNLIVDHYGLGNATFSGPITNGTAANISLGFTKNGPGTLILSNSGNTFSGPVVFNAGTIGIGANNALGTGPLTLNGGSFKATGGDRSIGNTMSGVGGLIFEGPNALTVGGASTAAGTNLVNSGTLRLGNPTALGLPVGVVVATPGVAANTTVRSGAALDLNGQQTVNEPIVLNGSGVGGTGALINSAAGTTARVGTAVSSLTINSFSSDITAPLAINITGNGSGATATASLGLTQAGIALTSPGGGYTANPTVTISGGGGTGATATAVRNGSVITGINLTNPGSGYTSVPTITFTGGGTGATQATATFNNGFFQLLNATLTAAGSGYTSGATASLSSGTAVITANASSVALATTSSVGGGGDIIIDGEVLGAGGLVKVGGGTVTLNAANSYSGGTTISGGTLGIASESALGSGGLTLTPFGTLMYTTTGSTSRSYALGGGTLAVAASQTLTLNGSQLSGGYLAGPGIFATNSSTGAAFADLVSRPSATINSNSSNDRFVNFTNGGSLNVAAALPAPVSMVGTTNAGSGTINVGAGSTINVSDLQSYGTLNLAPGTQAAPTLLTNVGPSDVFLSGGSRTFVGANQVGSVAKMDLGGRNLVVAGGLLVNNGGTLSSGGGIRNGTVIVDYGGRAKGTGFYEDIITQNGGVFSPGNSPGTTPVGTARISPGGVSNMDIDDAGTPGVAPNGQAGGSGQTGVYAPGWSLIVATSALRIYATPAQKQTISLTSQLLGGANAPGPVNDFDATRPYSWEFVRMDPLAQLFTTQTGGTAVDPASYSFDPSILNVDTSGFANLSQGGTYSSVFGPNSVGTYSLFVTFTPAAVPEPGTLALTAAAGVGLGWVTRRRRRARLGGDKHQG